MGKRFVIICSACAVSTAYAAFTSITREEAEIGRDVCVTGVVTCVAHWQSGSCIIAACDDPDGNAIYIAGEHPDGRALSLQSGGLAVGDIVVVEGTTTPMFFAPGISARSLRRTGKMKLPPAPVRSIADCSQGRLDNRRIRIGGVIRGLREVATNHVECVLATREGNIVVRGMVPLNAPDLASLVDAEVELSGVALSRYNHRSEYLGAMLELSGDDAVKIVKAAPSDPFAACPAHLNATLSWSPNGQDGHRRRVKGTVTLSRPDGRFYLQSGEAALCVWTAVPPPAGLAVEVSGFPEMIDGTGQLVDAVWRESGETPETFEPLEVKSISRLYFHDDVTFIDYDCRMISLTGRMEHIENKTIILTKNSKTVRVEMDGAIPSRIAKELELHPLLKVTGIARVDTSALEAFGRRPEIGSLTLVAAGPDAIEIVGGAAWLRRKAERNLRRIVTVLALSPILFIIAGVAIWRKNAAARRKDALLTAERKRMADDLHDTIEQHLAGARILLSTAGQSLGQTETPATVALKMAEDVLGNAKREIREVIMNLRQEELMNKSLRELLISLAKELNRTGTIRVRYNLAALAQEQSKKESAASNVDILAIVRQAVTNAVVHGGAKTAILVADTKPSFSIRILNDGAVFDATKAPGPDMGHFGLSNMRERAKRSGFTISWHQEGKWMCVELAR